MPSCSLTSPYPNAICHLQQDGDDKQLGSSLQEGSQGRGPFQTRLYAALPLITSNNVPDAVQTAFQVGDPGFAAPLAQACHQASLQVRHTAAV